MGKAQKIKAERRAERETAAARKQRRKRVWRRVGIVVVGAAIIAGAVFSALAFTNNPGRMETMTIETTKGTIQLELYPDKAPKTVAQIKTLADRGFYNGLTFHRVEPNFVVQGGDPKGDGTGGSDLPDIPFEKNDLKHDKGTIAMARSQDPNSANSQFYITLADAHFLDGNYVAFGRVTNGMDVVEQIQVGDKMTKVTVQ